MRLVFIRFGANVAIEAGNVANETGVLVAESVAKKVSGYLDSDKGATDAMRRGIANLSAVAGAIMRECALPKSAYFAVKAAVRRYGERLEKYDANSELRQLVKKTKVSIRSSVAVIRTPPKFRSLLKLREIERNARDFSLIESENAITIIVDDEYADEALLQLGKGSVLQVERGLHLISLTSPKELEKVPGFVAFATDALARSGINIKECFSCYTDTVFILEKEDAMKAFRILDAF